MKKITPSKPVNPLDPTKSATKNVCHFLRRIEKLKNNNHIPFLNYSSGSSSSTSVLVFMATPKFEQHNGVCLTTRYWEFTKTRDQRDQCAGHHKCMFACSLYFFCFWQSLILLVCHRPYRRNDGVSFSRLDRNDEAEIDSKSFWIFPGTSSFVCEYYFKLRVTFF